MSQLGSGSLLTKKQTKVKKQLWGEAKEKSRFREKRLSCFKPVGFGDHLIDNIQFIISKRWMIAS